MGSRGAMVAASTGFALLVTLAGLWSRHWDPSRFVTAGSDVTDAASAPSGLYVGPGGGYDGQFFYRLALDPLTAHQTGFGVRLDDPAYRQQRVGYPALAWVASLGGRPAFVPWALVGVNAAALAALGTVAGGLAAGYGRHRLWGLLVPLYPGFTMSLWRDLSEVVVVLAVLGGLLALHKGRPWAAAASLCVAVLTRETSVVVAVAGLAWLGWEITRGRRPKAGRWVTFALPVACFAGWQAVLWAHWGALGLSSGAGSATLPLVAPAARVWAVVSDPSLARLRIAAEVAVALAVVGWLAVGAVFALRAGAGDHVAVAGVASAVMVALLARDVWVEDWSFVRVVAEAVALGLVVGLRRPAARLTTVVAGYGALWVLVAPSLR